MHCGAAALVVPAGVLLLLGLLRLRSRFPLAVALLTFVHLRPFRAAGALTMLFGATLPIPLLVSPSCRPYLLLYSKKDHRCATPVAALAHM
jgi:hypothetical protein